MKKPYLLPHPFLWIGLALLIACAVTSVLCLLPSLGLTFSIVSFFSFQVILPLSFVIMCFSKEKVEDEMISETRHKSLKAAVIIYFAMLLLYPWASLLVTHLTSNYNSIITFQRITTDMVILPAAAYLITFRVKLWKQKKAISHEE